MLSYCIIFVVAIEMTMVKSPSGFNDKIISLTDELFFINRSSEKYIYPFPFKIVFGFQEHLEIINSSNRLVAFNKNSSKNDASEIIYQLKSIKGNITKKVAVNCHQKNEESLNNKKNKTIFIEHPFQLSNIVMGCLLKFSKLSTVDQYMLPAILIPANLKS